MGGKTVIAVVAAVALSMALGSCATTKLTGSWSDPSYTGGPFKKIMVVGVARREAMRKIFESTFAARLREHGTLGVPSGSFAPGAELLDKESLASKVTELGCDGVLVTRLLDRSMQTTYYPPTGYAVPRAYHGGYYHYYRQAYTVVYSPGYVVQSTTVSLETNLYDAASGALVWSGLTDTIVSEDPMSQVEEFVGILVAKLAEAHLIL
jgi:hypothetical protein